MRASPESPPSDPQTSALKLPRPAAPTRSRRCAGSLMWVEVVLLDREEHVERALEWAEGDGKRASGRARIPRATGRMPRDRGRPGRGPERGAGRAREAHDHDGIERTGGCPGIPGSNGDRQRSPDPLPGQAGRRRARARGRDVRGGKRDAQGPGESPGETASGGMGGAPVSASPVARAGTPHPGGPRNPGMRPPAVGNAAIPHHHPTRRRNPTPHDATPRLTLPRDHRWGHGATPPRASRRRARPRLLGHHRRPPLAPTYPSKPRSNGLYPPEPRENSQPRAHASHGYNTIPPGNPSPGPEGDLPYEPPLPPAPSGHAERPDEQHPKEPEAPPIPSEPARLHRVASIVRGRAHRPTRRASRSAA